MPRKTLHDVFKKVEDAKTKKEKINILKENSSPALKAVLGYTYDPNVKWLLPEGVPPYQNLKDDYDDSDIPLSNHIKKFYLFVDGPTDTQKNLSQVKRETIFVQTLETLEENEAKILIGMKDRKLPYKGVTRKLVAEAFPTLATNWF